MMYEYLIKLNVKNINSIRGEKCTLTLQPPHLGCWSISFIVSCCYSKYYGRFCSSINVSGTKRTICHRTRIIRTAIDSNEG